MFLTSTHEWLISGPRLFKGADKFEDYAFENVVEGSSGEPEAEVLRTHSVRCWDLREEGSS